MPNSTKAPDDWPKMPDCCEIVATVTYSYLPTRINLRPVSTFGPDQDDTPVSLLDCWPILLGFLIGAGLMLGAYVIDPSLFGLILSGLIFGAALIIGLGIGFKLISFAFDLTDRWS